MNDTPEPYDSHVTVARKIFRDVGFDLAAMQFKRSTEALHALRRFNNVPDSWVHPFAWNYHPNAYCARKWQETGELA